MQLQPVDQDAKTVEEMPEMQRQRNLNRLSRLRRSRMEPQDEREVF